MVPQLQPTGTRTELSIYLKNNLWVVNLYGLAAQNYNPNNF